MKRTVRSIGASAVVCLALIASCTGDEPPTAAISAESRLESLGGRNPSSVPAHLIGQVHNQALESVARELQLPGHRQSLDGGDAPIALKVLNRHLARRHLGSLSDQDMGTLMGMRGQVHAQVMQRRSERPDFGIASYDPEAYMHEIYDQIGLSGSPEDVSVRVRPIVDRARIYLVGEELEAVIAIASIAVESSAYWAGGGFEQWAAYCESHRAECEEIAGGIIRDIEIQGSWSWRRTAGTDVGGGMLGWWLGPGVLKMAIGASLIDGVIQTFEGHRVF